MQFVKPSPFREAIQKLDQRTIVTSRLDSEAWSRIPLALRERALWSSEVESARFLQKGRNAVGDFLNSAREENGQLRIGSRADFVKQMQDFAIKEGLGPLDPKDVGSIKDIRTEGRLGLIFDTQTRQAQDYGWWKQGQDPDILDAFPAQRFVRVVEVKEPRDFHHFHENEVQLKSDLGFWRTLNQDFGVPWGPWGWGCGHDVEDVDRDEAVRLGLIKADEPAKSIEADFNARLEASVKGLDEDMRRHLRDSFGDQIEITDETARWMKAPGGIELPPPPPRPQPAPAPAPAPVPVPAPKPDPSDRVVDIVKRHTDRTRPIRDEVEKLTRDLQAIDPNDTGLLDLALRRAKAQARMARLEKKMDRAIQRMVKADAPGAYQPKLPSSISHSGASEVDFVNAVTGRTLPPSVKVKHDKAETRSYYHPVLKEVVMANQFREGVIAHELGHAIEDHFPEILRRSKRFLEQRASKGLDKALANAPVEEHAAIRRKYQPRRLSEITGIPYGPWETAIEDDFTEPYAGKIYPAATEIMSLGLEWLFRKPAEFARTDPDYFRFVIRNLRGIDHEVEL